VLESACEGCCSDEGYFRGFSRGVGLRFEIGVGFRAGLRTGFRFRFRFRFRFGIPLRNLLQRVYRTLIDRLDMKGIEIGLGNDGTGIVNWGL
jgi:hypothetical protein